MNKYEFETSEFGVSEKGIHLLRSRFNYETINFDEIDHLFIKNGKQLNNWIVIFIAGLIFVALSLFCGFHFLLSMFKSEVHYKNGKMILILVLPLMLGFYNMYTSTRNCLIFTLKTSQNKKFRFPLNELQQKKQVTLLRSFLKEKLKNRIEIND